MPDGEELWYRDAVIYEVPVRAFSDSDSDGIGDFRGLTQKLDYLQDLGVTAVWLLPFYPSPLKDDGYDIADYTSIHPSYGTIRDFKLFLREARRQGIRVITELVLNHTSDQHPWFQRARRARPGTPARDWYVWSDTHDRYLDARVIFKDFETSNWAWDPVAQAYFWHRFYSHQPDLNFESREVREALFQVVDFWLEMGVDGMRLDAVPYLFEREGTSCENLPETHRYLKELRRHVDRRLEARMLLAEANQWPEDAVAYFGDGDECHMAFHFPVMPRMFMAIRMEDRFPIVDIMQQTPPISETCQWAVFLRNHDELTLEMVTDEERDYMYRVYAQDPQARINLGIRRRLAPLLGNDRKTIELMNGLLFSLPGTPVIYYGDEIGMGDNIYLGDRNGVRTPMQWSGDRNAGFSRANPQKLYLPAIIDPEYHFEAINVEAQQNNPNSLLWWMKRALTLRKQFRALGRGTLEFLYPANQKVLAFVRAWGDERILVVANLSRFPQYAELDLGEFRGTVPVELFGRTEFPRIGELPYLLTLGPHAFYWFSLPVRPAPVVVTEPRREIPVLEVGDWESLFTRRGKGALEHVLPAYLLGRRWFGGKARGVKSIGVTEMVRVPAEGSERRDSQPAGYVVLAEVEYTEGDPETYVLPMAAQPMQRRGDVPSAEHLVARLRTRAGEMVLYDALRSRTFCRALLEAVARRRVLAGGGGRLLAVPSRAYRRVAGTEDERLDPRPLRGEQSNTSVVYGDRLMLKLFRRLDEGSNPDLEIGRFLTERVGFEHAPPVAGAVEYQVGRRPPSTVAILHGFVPNGGDAWQFTLDALGRYFEQALIKQAEVGDPPLPGKGPLLEMVGEEPPALARETIGAYLEPARLLGARTAELHLALSSNHEEPAFAPEPITPLYQRSLYQSMRTLTAGVFRLVRDRAGDHPETVQVLDLEDDVMRRFRALLDVRLTASRIRCHGDYHLGQVLYTGRDFVIIDFEGEPARPLGERRIKRPPLQDVAGMLRSFHYACYSTLYGPGGGIGRPEDLPVLEPWARFWTAWTSAAFLGAYLETARGASFLPEGRRELEVLLDVFMLGKAVYELGYEVNHRPDWVKVAIQGIVQLLEGES